MTESATGMDEGDDGMFVMAVIVTLFAAMLDGSSRISSIRPASNETVRRGPPPFAKACKSSRSIPFHSAHLVSLRSAPH